MYLNQFAQGLDALDMTQSEEFASLVQSARDLEMNVELPVRYVSRNHVVNGLRIHFLEWGDPSAPPIVVAHGGNQTAHSWDLVNIVLARKFHVIALDQRGHGDSEHPRDGDMAATLMSDDMVAMIEALGLEKPMIFGHSMGGAVTMFTLLRHPGIASRAVIVDVSPERNPDGGGTIRNFVQANRVEFDSMETFIENVRKYDPFRPEEHIRRTARYNLLLRADGKYVSKQSERALNLAAVARPSLEETRQIDIPLLLVRGGESNVLTPEAAERFASTLPQGTLVTVPRCGHNVHTQNTPGFLAEVLPYIGY